MNAKIIQTDKAPAPIGQYSQGIQAGNFIFCSGQIGLDPKNGTLVEGIEAQTKQALSNLAEILKAANSSMENVVKTTIYLKDIADFPKVNEWYAEVFQKAKPVRTTVGVVSLPKGALVEIDAIAELNKAV